MVSLGFSKDIIRSIMQKSWRTTGPRRAIWKPWEVMRFQTKATALGLKRGRLVQEMPSVRIYKILLMCKLVFTHFCTGMCMCDTLNGDYT